MRVAPPSRIPFLPVALAALGACASNGTGAPAAGAAMWRGYYAEVLHEGRIHVFGSEDAHAAFQSDADSVEFVVTRIGWGPDGETVRFQGDAGDPGMTERLVATFSARYGVD